MMTDRENQNLSKLSRKELLQILLKQTQIAERFEKSYRRNVIQLKSVQTKNEDLEAENESLQKQIREMERKMNRMSEELEERRILIEESGSIAEAAVRINGLFEAAQKTVDDFVRNVRKNSEEEGSHPTT